MVNEIKEENTAIVNKTIVCGEIYFYCKINDTLVWFHHQDDLPMKYKELVEDVK